MTGQYDLIVIGDEAAAYCAAACSAKRAARVGLLKIPTKTPEKKRRRSQMTDGIPNFVWRRLDLQRYDIAVAPVSAVVSLLADGKTISTVESIAGTQSALQADDIGDHALWSDFARDVSAMSDDAASISTQLAAGAAMSGANGARTATMSIDDLAGLAASCADWLDDYFENEALKTHIAVQALSRQGLGGAEAGSVGSLASLFDAAAWPHRLSTSSPPLCDTLEKVCIDAGVEIIEGAIASVDASGDKFRHLNLSGGERLKTKLVICASPAAARRAGVRTTRESALFDVTGAAQATVSIKLSDRIEPPAGDAKAAFFIIDEFDDLQEARDAVVEGRLPEKLPVSFEIRPPDEIIVKTAYCPDRFMEDDEPREWTGQDRQAVIARVIERMAERFPDFKTKIQHTDIFLDGARFPDDQDPIIIDDPKIIIQPLSTNKISAAVTLADQLLNDH